MADTARLYRGSGAERWGVAQEVFAQALDRSTAKAFAGRTPTPSDIERYQASLHLQDLALACACAEGHNDAWDHFVAEYRPALYRAADAIDRTGGARELADAIYGELFSKSLFRYFHGRSSLATWLRSLLSQRYVDRFRETRRLEALPDDEIAAAAPVASPDQSRFVAAMQAVLAAAIAALDPRERLRLRCYYAEDMTLAQIGRVTRESEATVSRQLTRTRRTLRDELSERLKREHGFSDGEIAECVSSVSGDAGTLDLGQLLNNLSRPRPTGEGGRKKEPVDRSEYEDVS
jgi:RNA polymerase sigma-70 factor (ECF subfamily)